MFEQPNSPYDTYHRSIDPDRDPDRDRDLTSAAKYMTRVQLIDQGTFGCIYKPEIDCMFPKYRGKPKRFKMNCTLAIW